MRPNRARIALAVGAAVAALSLVSPAWADVALSFTGGIFVPSQNDQTIGWTFTANAASIVTSLAWYDPGDLNSLQHTVDLWTSSGTLVGSACVGSGCTNSSFSGSYWATPADLKLASGTTYVLGGWVNNAGSDTFNLEESSITTDPLITYINGFYSVGAQSDALPTLNTGFGGLFGPNLSLSASAAPEPATWSMMLFGLFSIGALARGAGRKRDVSRIAA